MLFTTKFSVDLKLLRTNELNALRKGLIVDSVRIQLNFDCCHPTQIDVALLNRSEALVTHLSSFSYTL